MPQNIIFKNQNKNQWNDKTVKNGGKYSSLLIAISWGLWIVVIGGFVFAWNFGYPQYYSGRLVDKIKGKKNTNETPTKVQNIPLGQGEKSSYNTSAGQISAKPKLLSVSNKSLNMGNIFFGRYIDDWSMRAANPAKGATAVANESDSRDFNYPFSGLASFERNKYDSWIAGLECPVTPNFRSSEVQDTDLKFNCLPDYIGPASKWFNSFSLANNHTDNMQEIDGFTQTKAILEKNDIQHFGHFDNAITDENCDVANMPARANYDDGTVKKINIPIAYCGYHNVFKLPTESELLSITKFSKYFPTFVFPHGGAEYTTKSDGIKRELYRSMIDAGADTVIGDHPHTTQETEIYNGKLIVYSLGNFIFDQQSNFNVTTGVALDIDMKITGSENYNNVIEKLGDKCSSYQDNCLDIVKKEGGKKPVFTLDYDIIASDNSGKLTKKGSVDIQNAMLQRTNWARTMELYKKP